MTKGAPPPAAAAAGIDPAPAPSVFRDFASSLELQVSESGPGVDS